VPQTELVLQSIASAFTSTYLEIQAITRIYDRDIYNKYNA